MDMMRHFKHISAGLLAATLAIAALAGCKKETPAAETTALPPGVKPDALATCPVSGEKLGGEMGKPVVFVYQGQEVKLCCAMCRSRFDSDPATYVKKIQDAAAKN